MTFNVTDCSGAGIAALIAGTFYGTSQTITADTIKAALYNNTPTPNKNDTFANNAYNAGQWVVANEITGTNYTAGGNAMASLASANSSGTVSVSAANTSWTTATFSGTFGCLVYDSTITGKNAYCWNYFGGTQSVTAGTFTIAWSSGNIFTVTIT